MRDPARDAVEPLQKAHYDRPFPPRLRGEVIDGVDMVMVDADVVGCVQVWMDSSSNLDAPRIQVLRACLSDLDRVLPLLTEPLEHAYYSGLRDLANAVLQHQRGWH